MIFRIDHTSFCTWDRNKIPLLLWSLVKHHHLVDCVDHKVREDIKNCFNVNVEDDSNVSRICKTLFEITSEQRLFFTTINVSDFSFKQLMLLAGEKSRILIENGPYEWDIYKYLAKAYKRDPKYGNIFGYVLQAIESHDLVCLHGGGVTVYDALIQLEEEDCYPDNIFAFKHVIVFDRDTPAENELSPNQNVLFGRFCNKKCAEVDESDAYSLSQSPYIWHVWYKRAIENYFPNERYEQLGVGTKQLPTVPIERDYCKMEVLLNGYNKKMMKNIAKGMSLKQFESHLHTFRVNLNDELIDLSEFQLLLLKITRII